MTEVSYVLAGFAGKFADFKGKKLLLHGSREYARAIIESFDSVFHFAGVMSFDPMEGDTFCGVPVYQKEDLPALAPDLIILTDDGSYTSYLRSGSGQWNLFKVFRQDEQTYLDFDEESIVFRTPIDQQHSRFETVHGRFERDLRKIDLNSIPGTPEEAERMRDEMQPATEDAGGQ